jgi:hypothetical protein
VTKKVIASPTSIPSFSQVVEAFNRHEKATARFEEEKAKYQSAHWALDAAVATYNVDRRNLQLQLMAADGIGVCTMHRYDDPGRFKPADDLKRFLTIDYSELYWIKIHNACSDCRVEAAEGHAREIERLETKEKELLEDADNIAPERLRFKLGSIKNTREELNAAGPPRELSDDSELPRDAEEMDISERDFTEYFKDKDGLVPSNIQQVRSFTGSSLTLGDDSLSEAIARFSK